MFIKKHKIIFTTIALIFLLIVVVWLLAALVVEPDVRTTRKTALQSLNNLRGSAALYVSTASSSGMYATVPLPPQVCERTQGTMFEDNEVYSYVSRATSLSGVTTAICAADADRYAILVGPVKTTGESVCIDNTLPESILVNGSLTGPVCPEPVPPPRKFPFTIFPFNLIPVRQ